MKKSYPLRIDDELYLKMQHISQVNSRSINKEIEFLMKQYVSNFEKENGTISVNLENLYE